MVDSAELENAPTTAGVGHERVRLVTALPEGSERYQTEGLIGQGGMGVVRSRFDRRIGRCVASKELRPELAQDQHIRARFLREAQVQGQLEHPAIVPVYDLGMGADGLPYFTMRTVRGITLAEILHAKRHTRHRVLSAFTSICLAVDYAHQRGIVHRDLKPANLILGDYGEVYVLDWGLAKIQYGPDVGNADMMPWLDGMTHAGALLGTPGYMAPEQIADSSRVGPATDVYSLGAILFEILTGEPLHSRADAIESTRRGADARTSLRAPGSDAPPELESVCIQATAQDPAKRPSARQVSDAVGRYLEGERDLELRRKQSAEQALAAAQAAQEVRSGGSIDARRRAMQAIGRALALDPMNVEAVSTLVALLSQPPENPPPEVAGEIERRFRQDIRWVSSVGTGVYASILGFLAVVLWMGIRRPWIVAGFFALMAASAALSYFVARTRRPRTSTILVAMAASGLAFAFATRFLSPLLLAPTALAINATGYAVFLRRGQRLVVTLASCAAFLLPLVLELGGVLGPTFQFDGGRLVILPSALALPAAPTLTLIVAASVLGVFLGSLLVGHIRDRLADAERRIQLYAWHLREFVPPHARRATDPTA